jgi:hypothetical protein
MHLDEEKKQKVAAWIEQGLKLSDIQSKLSSELGLPMTYMEVRLLVNDLKLIPKDQPPPQARAQISGKATAPAAGPLPPGPGAAEPFPEEFPTAQEPAPGGVGQVSVSVDQLARAGTMVSGNVTFSDGQTAGWYLDQMGRLGIVPKQANYRPSESDVQRFQMELQNQLQKLGF